MTNSFLEIIKKDKFFSIVIVIALLSLLRSLIVPLQGDELTYIKLTENIFNGRYYLENHPSTITPVIPFIIALFYTPFNPIAGFVFVKLFNITLTFLGFRFVYLFFNDHQLDKRISVAIILLTLINTNSIAWFATLYPEAMLLFSFWGFIYYYTKEPCLENFKKMLLFLLLLFMTRYVYGILGVLVLLYYYKFYNSNMTTTMQLKKVFIYSILFIIPVLLWFKYVYMIELNQVTEISYFHRFKTENSFWSNIQYGLGFGIHPEVSRVNGIPAFISLFIPMTGIRNYGISVVLIFLFIAGYIRGNRNTGFTLIIISTVLVMLGLIIAGTGFSRYWLILLPSFYLGYYLLFNSFKLANNWFVNIVKVLCVIYILNELRLDYMILNKYL